MKKIFGAYENVGAACRKQPQIDAPVCCETNVNNIPSLLGSGYMTKSDQEEKAEIGYENKMNTAKESSSEMESNVSNESVTINSKLENNLEFIEKAHAEEVNKYIHEIQSLQKKISYIQGIIEIPEIKKNEYIRSMLDVGKR